MDTGDNASIYVNAHQVSPNGRGYNLVAIDPTSGQQLWSESFDTFASAAESNRLVNAVERLPRGTIVAGAVRDEASTQLTEPAIAALRSLGGMEDIRGRYRVSHLLIGVKGAAPPRCFRLRLPRLRPAEEAYMRRAPLVGFALALGSAAIIAQQAPSPATRDPQRELMMNVADGFTVAVVLDLMK